MSTPAVPLALAIMNVEGSTPAEFAVTRLDDGKSVAPVPISSPYDFPVLGQPNSNLMHELRWYLERFLDYPFPPETDRAERVLESLKAWGRQAFNSVFDQPDAAEWFATSTIVQVCSDDPHVLSWPWEALFDPQADYVAHGRRIERRTDKACDPQSLATLPSDRVNILLVVARPLEHDVAYRSVARSLVELIQSQRLPVHLDILRPPTFDQLRDHLVGNAVEFAQSARHSSSRQCGNSRFRSSNRQSGSNAPQNAALSPDRRRCDRTLNHPLSGSRPTLGC